MSKCYVVWKGKVPGIYDTWEECKNQVSGFSGASYKSFSSKKEGEHAFKAGPEIKSSEKREFKPKTEDYIMDSICVDAACSGNPGPMEYQGVFTYDKNQVIFSFGPMQGTNNIGEFLAIVEGLKFLKENEMDVPLYSDSVTAMLWIKRGKANTTLKLDSITQKVLDEAEDWLRTNTYQTQILKWETKKWGEIKADFGRK